MSKTRHQTLFQFLESLQIEYVNAELRKKIYPIIKDKKYHQRVMQHKKQKIIDIATRNGLPTIFSNDDEKSRIYSIVYRDFGLPNFLYRNKQEIQEFRKWDVINYFATASEVKIKEGDRIRVGHIIDNTFIRNRFYDNPNAVIIDHSKDIVEVKFRRSSKVVPVLIKNIARIL